MSDSLAGQTVLITRAAEDAEPLKTRLEQLGAHVCVAPALKVRAASDPQSVQVALDALGKVGWVVFASRNGVRFFSRLLGDHSQVLPQGVKLAGVGPGTAAAITEAWRAPDLVAKVATAEGLAEDLVATAQPSGGDILLPAAAKGRRALQRLLSAAGFAVRRLTVYETVPTTEADGGLTLPARVDYVLFASPSSVKGFLARSPFPDGARVVSIGPTTSRAVEQAGLTVARQARQHNLDGLIEVLTCLE